MRASQTSPLFDKLDSPQYTALINRLHNGRLVSGRLTRHGNNIAIETRIMAQTEVDASTAQALVDAGNNQNIKVNPQATGLKYTDGTQVNVSNEQSGFKRETTQTLRSSTGSRNITSVLEQFPSMSVVDTDLMHGYDSSPYGNYLLDLGSRSAWYWSHTHYQNKTEQLRLIWQDGPITEHHVLTFLSKISEPSSSYGTSGQYLQVRIPPESKTADLIAVSRALRGICYLSGTMDVSTWQSWGRDHLVTPPEILFQNPSDAGVHVKELVRVTENLTR